MISMKNIDTYDLPIWLQQYWEMIVNNTFHKLLEECRQYKEIYDECEKMLDKHKFISTVMDGDAIKNSIALTDEEVKQLSKYLQMFKDCNELEQMQIYLYGSRDMYYMLKLLEIIE